MQSPWGRSDPGASAPGPHDRRARRQKLAEEDKSAVALGPAGRQWVVREPNREGARSEAAPGGRQRQGSVGSQQPEGHPCQKL